MVNAVYVETKGKSTTNSDGRHWTQYKPRQDSGQLLTCSHAQSPRNKEEPGALADIRNYRDGSGWEATEVYREL